MFCLRTVNAYSTTYITWAGLITNKNAQLFLAPCARAGKHAPVQKQTAFVLRARRAQYFKHISVPQDTNMFCKDSQNVNVACCKIPHYFNS